MKDKENNKKFLDMTMEELRAVDSSSLTREEFDEYMIAFDKATEREFEWLESMKY